MEKPLGSSRDTVPQKILKSRRFEMLFCTFSWRCFLKKINFGKGQNIKGYKEIFQFLFCSASLIENIHHTLMPSLASVLTDLRKRQSRFSLIPSKLCFLFTTLYNFKYIQSYYFTKSKWLRNWSIQVFIGLPGHNESPA